jgi:hypothetical protein
MKPMTTRLLVALDPTWILAAQGLHADPWQRDVLFSNARQVLLNCCRGAGKSRVTSALALREALARPHALVLLVSRSQRQSGELFRYVKQGFSAIGRPLAAVCETQTHLEFANGSRIVAVPGKEATIRSFQGVNLLILDEAARIPDDLYASVSPMTGVSGGRTICLSTPFGQRGWFWKEWHDAKAPWQRFDVPWNRCPRLGQAFLDEERRKFGPSWVAQEYEGSFTSMEGLVYADFARQTATDEPAPPGRRVGGIDFGFRNPFAAVWGTLRDDVLCIDREIYLCQTPLTAILPRLPRDVQWFADPAGAVEIAELRVAGYNVRPAINDIRAGVAAVTARLQTQRLRVREISCPNLLAEARLYRYPTRQARAVTGENPVDEHNHALAALRYLVSRLDERAMSRIRRHELPDAAAPAPWLHVANDALWQN